MTMSAPWTFQAGHNVQLGGCTHLKTNQSALLRPEGQEEGEEADEKEAVEKRQEVPSGQQLIALLKRRGWCV